jgi:hypothetical protein
MTCLTLAQGQSISSLSSSPVLTPIPDHPAHAAAHDMLPERTLLLGAYATASGEQPLVDVYKPVPTISLGAIAKICRDDARDPRCTYRGEL